MDRLTVKELIKQLQEMPQDAEVYTEGCDCYGDAAGVMQNADNSVLITRTELEKTD
jgi:hypothetical protein